MHGEKKSRAGQCVSGGEGTRGRGDELSGKETEEETAASGELSVSDSGLTDGSERAGSPSRGTVFLARPSQVPPSGLAEGQFSSRNVLRENATEVVDFNKVCN